MVVYIFLILGMMALQTIAMGMIADRINDLAFTVRLALKLEEKRRELSRNRKKV